MEINHTDIPKDERSLINVNFASRVDDKHIDKVVGEIHKSTGFRYPKKLPRVAIIAVSILLVLSAFLLARSQFSYAQVEYLAIDQLERSSFATDIPAPKEPKQLESRIATIDSEAIDAASIYAYNPVTHQVYYERNIDEKRKIASITKLMTATIVLDEYNLDEEITITDKLLDSYPDEVSHVVGFKAGDRVTLGELFDAALINSYNDAALLLAASHPDGYEAFLLEMNRRAQLLGMANTNFSNPQGYDAVDNYSTARDIQKLTAYAMQYEYLMETVQKKTAEITIEHADGTEEIVELESTNKLLDSIKYTKGLKTGYTAEAGPSLVGYFDAGEESKLVTIILGGNDDRFKLTEDLYYLLGKSYK